MLRTPEECFDGLPDFAFAFDYATVRGPQGEAARLAYVDEGDPAGPPVLLMHGEPTWSFLYRKMIPGLVDAGFRVIAPDLIGFGRSDKPATQAEHSYAAHVEWARSALFDHLDLRDVTLFCQDWGGLIGLRLVGEHPDRFARVCAANTGLPDGSRRMGKAWQGFYAFVQASEDLPIGLLCSGGVVDPMAPAVVAGYEAPFPGPEYKAAAKAMPGLIPQEPEAPGAAENRAAWQVLERFDRPFLCLFSDGDPITAGADKVFCERVPGTAGQPHGTVRGGHFLQEDAGPELASRLADWAKACESENLP
jgi:haloalkane dehalogenase